MARHKARVNDRTRKFAVTWCGGCEKKLYPTKADARSAAVETSRKNAARDRVDETPLRAFWCDTAKGWHIGHAAVPGPNLNDPRLTFLGGER